MGDPAIDALYAAWADAFRRNNVDAVLQLLTPDYVLWPAGAAPVTRDALAPMLVAAFTTYEITPSFEREELLVSGDLAIDRGWDVQQLRRRVDGGVLSHRQRVFLVLRRGADGRWRVARGMSQPGGLA